MTYIFFLGNHPIISAVEVWTVLQQKGFNPLVSYADQYEMIIEVEGKLPTSLLQRLGGVIQVGQLKLSSANLWPVEELASRLGDILEEKTKVTVGLSSSKGIPRSYTRELGPALKKIARNKGTRLRFVTATGKNSNLNAAQIIFNQLTTPPNQAWQIIRDEQGFSVAKITHIQDIQAYAKRDIERPWRDPKVGMLPPKLAQMILNISMPDEPKFILDPFCGLGTVLQEGWLLGHRLIGTDSSEQMLRASQKNLAYVAKLWAKQTPLPELKLHDATKPFSFLGKSVLDAVVTEPFLGPPLTKPLPSFQLAERIEKLGQLYLKVFRAIHPQLKKGGKVLFLLPAWRAQIGQLEFDLMPTKFIDSIGQIGYHKAQLIPEELNRFYSTSNRADAIYARPDALVGREITYWEKL